MALLTDDGWIGVGDLAEEDSGILDLAQRESVDLAAKLRLAVNDIRAEVHAFLRKYSIYSGTNAVVSWDLQRWAVFHSLSSAYRDAYFHQLNDRYSTKWKLYAQQAKDAKEQVWYRGVGVVYRPLPRPAAPEAELLGGDQAPRSYWVALTWVGGDGKESSLGDALLLQPTSLHQLTLRPGQQAPSGTLWHVYAGEGPDEMFRQTLMPLEVGSTWELPPAGITSGTAAKDVQKADKTIRMRRVLRGQ